MALHCLSKKQSCLANQGFASLIATNPSPQRDLLATWRGDGLKFGRAKALDFWHTIAYKARDSFAL
jgi:hypothetical protein